MSRKHVIIPQLDGNNIDEEEDNLYENTKHYWKRKYLGSAYQTFIDANKVIDESPLNEDEKKEEIASILEARKEAIGKYYQNFPPWS